MIAVTNLFISSIKITVLAHYLMFSLTLQWLMEDYLSPFQSTSNIFLIIFFKPTNPEPHKVLRVGWFEK